MAEVSIDVLDRIATINVYPKTKDTAGYVACFKRLLSYFDIDDFIYRPSDITTVSKFAGGAISFPSVYTDVIEDPIVVYATDVYFVDQCKNSFYKSNIEKDIATKLEGI